MSRLSRVLLLLLLGAGRVTAQTDTLTPQPPAVDTVPTLREINRAPRNALLWSIIPGGGQVYNKRWWKVPLVYSSLLGIIAVADFNQERYGRFVQGLRNRCLGDGIPDDCTEVEDDFTRLGVTSEGLRLSRNNADRARQQAWFGILAVYLLQGVEAYTDAQLMEFDISDDISFRVAPAVLGGGAAGARLIVPLGSGARRARQEAWVYRHRLSSPAAR